MIVKRFGWVKTSANPYFPISEPAHNQGLVKELSPLVSQLRDSEIRKGSKCFNLSPDSIIYIIKNYQLTAPGGFSSGLLAVYNCMDKKKVVQHFNEWKPSTTGGSLGRNRMEGRVCQLNS